MKTIPIEQVEEVWERVSDASEKESKQIAKRLQKKQPFVMVYLLAMDENLLEGRDRGRLLELGTFIHEIMSSVNCNLRKVTGEELEAAEDANLKFLEEMDAGSEMDFVAGMQKMVASYNQMPLLGAVLEALMQGHEEHPELAPENLGMVLLDLKTVIDCLDQ